MRTIVVKIDLDDAAVISQDWGNLSWERTTSLMRDLEKEIQFFHKRIAKPKAVRLGNVRIVLAGFYDTREAASPSRDEPREEDDE